MKGYKEKPDDLPDPIIADKICEKFENVMAMLEITTGTSRTVEMGKPLAGNEISGFRWEGGELHVVNFPTATEAIRNYSEQAEKLLNIISPERKKRTEELILRAKLYLASV